MANSKNTIQQIPLNGTLDMNILRTEVKQFEGFNEKNSTVFGGTLSPIYEKTSELSEADNSYTVYNSKGIPFTLKNEDGQINLYRDTTKIDGVSGTYVTDNTTFEVPDNTITAIETPDNKVLAINKYGKIISDGEEIGSFALVGDIIQAQIWYVGGLSIVSGRTAVFAAMTTTQTEIVLLKSNGDLKSSGVTDLPVSIQSGMSPIFTGGYNSITSNFHVFAVCKSGENAFNASNAIMFTIVNSNAIYVTSSSNLYVEDFSKPGLLESLYCTIKADNVYDFAQYAFRQVQTKTITDSDALKWIYSDSYNNNNAVIKVAKKSEVSSYLPKCPMGKYGDTGSVYYQNGSLISIGRRGQVIDTCLDYGRDLISAYTVDNDTIHVCYQKNNGTWHHYKEINASNITEAASYLKGLILDGRYISFYGSSSVIYDIEEEKKVEDASNLDWIISAPPYIASTDMSDSATGTINFSVSGNLSKTDNNGNYAFNMTITQDVDVDFDHSYFFYLHWKQIFNETVVITIPAGEKEASYSTNKLFPLKLGEPTYALTLQIITASTTYSSAWQMSFPVGETETKTGSFVITPVNGLVTTTTGIMYGAAVNAGYMVNNANFVGYMPNPFADTFFPSGFAIHYPELPDNVQYYCTANDSVQSASYAGNQSKYFGTTYAIDSNANIVLPVSMNAEIINGYSNNDMVVESGTAYPIMYFNNNQKIYAYFLLAAVENMTGVFSLQGQSYLVDDNNIYSATFDSGVVSAITPVCYKKNMTYLGSLSNYAVFYSYFNKTFYSFAGDRTLTKMFEASYIDTIGFVGQNPSSLSLWIVTDKGTYVMSDVDMYKLDYKPTYISFQNKYAVLITEESGKNVVHAISLYKDDDDNSTMIPVKLETAFYGTGSEMKSVMDCWYIRLFDNDRTEGDVKIKINTITDVTRTTEEKVFHVSQSDYDSNNIVYLRYQPKYQDCVAMQLSLESPIGIYSLAVGVNATDSTAQVSRINF